MIESDADRYGLALANEPDAAATALLRTVDFRASNPGFMEEFLFYDHPSIAHRIGAAMTWKAEHTDLANPAGDVATTQAASTPHKQN
jgi:STE24 endopeptidase